MADALFEEPRLARVYDPLDPDRDDLAVYAAIAEEFGARSVLDIGCGTGTFACLLAGRSVNVIGVDPAGPRLMWPGPSPVPGGCAGCGAMRPTCLRSRSSSRR